MEKEEKRADQENDTEEQSFNIIVVRFSVMWEIL